MLFFYRGLHEIWMGFRDIRASSQNVGGAVMVGEKGNAK